MDCKTARELQRQYIIIWTFFKWIMNFSLFRFRCQPFFFCDFHSMNAIDLYISHRLSNVAIRYLLSLQHSKSFWIFQDGSNLQNCLLWLLWINITAYKMFFILFRRYIMALLHKNCLKFHCLFFICNYLLHIFFNCVF